MLGNFFFSVIGIFPYTKWICHLSNVQWRSRPSLRQNYEVEECQIHRGHSNVCWTKKEWMSPSPWLLLFHPPHTLGYYALLILGTKYLWQFFSPSKSPLPWAFLINCLDYFHSLLTSFQPSSFFKPFSTVLLESSFYKAYMITSLLCVKFP